MRRTPTIYYILFLIVVLTAAYQIKDLHFLLVEHPEKQKKEGLHENQLCLFQHFDFYRYIVEDHTVKTSIKHIYVEYTFFLLNNNLSKHACILPPLRAPPHIACKHGQSNKNQHINNIKI